MNRTMRPVSRAKAAKSRISSSLRPRTRTTLTLSGESPAASAASMAARTVAELAPPTDRAEPLGAQRVTADVHPPQPRCQRTGSAASASSIPFVVMARSSNPSAARRPTRTGRPLRTSGSPPVSRIDDTPSLHGHPGHPDDLVEGEEVRVGEEGHPLLGHAVDAAQVAAVGDRDAQVVVDPAVGDRPGDRRWAWRRDDAPGLAGSGPRWRRGPWSPWSDGLEDRLGDQTVGVDEHDLDNPAGSHARRRREARPGRWHRPWPADGASPVRPSGAPAIPRLASSDRADRTKWVLPSGRRRSAVSATARTTGWSSERWPALAGPPGRTSSSKLTMADTGFPGRPKTGVPTPRGLRRRTAWPVGSPPASTASSPRTASRGPP